MEEELKAQYLSDLNFFQSVAEENPNEDYSLPMAFINLAIGDYAEVISKATKSLRGNPFYTSLQVILAEALLYIGRVDESQETLFDILGVNEDNYKALKLMGIIYKNGENKDNAIKYLHAAHLRAPEDIEITGWLEELGGLEQVSDKQSVEEDNFFDDEEDVSKLNIDNLIENANTALDDIMRSMSEYKQAGKTLENMIHDHAVQLKADQKAAKVVEAETTEVPLETPVTMPADLQSIELSEELSDDQILDVLTAANIKPEDENTAPKEKVDINSMFAAATEAAKQAAQILVEHEELTSQMADTPPIDMKIPLVDDPESPEMAPLLSVETPILDSYKDELEKIAGVQPENFSETIGSLPIPEDVLADFQEAAEAVKAEIYKVETAEVPGLLELPKIPEELPIVPQGPHDPTGDIVEDLLSDAVFMDIQNTPSSVQKSLPPELIDPTMELVSNLTAISRGESIDVIPLEEDTVVELPKITEAAPFQAELEAESLPPALEIPSEIEYSELDITPESVSAEDKASFIPKDLVDSVFKDAGGIEEVFGEGSEPIERKQGT